MKIKFYLFLLLFCAGNVFTLKAQQVVALQQSGNARFFSGTDAFRLAYDAASSGDTIYLSGGSFTAPDTIAKTITVFGAGHYPEFTGPTGQTMLSGNLFLATGADNSYFEGMRILDRLEFVVNHKINDLVFRRCRINGAVYSSSSYNNTNHVENALFTECVLANTNSTTTFTNFRNLTLTNCILTGQISSVYYGTIANCIQLHPTHTLIYSSNNTVVKNCISATPTPFGGATSNLSFLNNVFFNFSEYNFGNHVESNNYFGVTREGFFKDQEGNIFDYTHDYNLQSPETFLGADGIQVGIYGGMHPWKEGSVPMIPHIISKNISHSVDAEGNLKVEINVSAQEY
jgi:hypothetical protein